MTYDEMNKSLGYKVDWEQYFVQRFLSKVGEAAEEMSKQSPVKIVPRKPWWE